MGRETHRSSHRREKHKREHDKKSSSSSSSSSKSSKLSFSLVKKKSRALLEQQRRKERLDQWRREQQQHQHEEEENSAQKEDNSTTNEPEIDPLDAFMKTLHSELEEPTSSSITNLSKKHQLRINDNEEELMREDLSVEWRKEAENEEKNRLILLKRRKIALLDVDHSTIKYANFRKNFFIEPADIKAMTDLEITSYRKNDLGGCRIRGKGCPRPIKTWSQCGLHTIVYTIITQKYKFSEPSPIQKQAIPAIMSGRDVIGCAKTGSGKTLAFVLPLLRHVADQPPLEPGDGPIALIMAPTRELALQIYTDTRKLARHIKTDGTPAIRAVCVYGGCDKAHQISDLKRGAEIVVCTPGRLIDVLTSNSGRITNLKRVTFLVLDEADRMFDLGFEPQIKKIVECIRPDRQTVMFSATFPVHVELLAKSILKKPIEIIIGRGRSIACDNIDQNVLILDEPQKFPKLLELLSKWQSLGLILVFVDTQQSADNLFQELTGANYRCAVLHGGVDQIDRDDTIDDFKSGTKSILVATSVAARGLDVENLILVINYDVPNHIEDYVHRIGRTGRAGRHGTAFTFLEHGQSQYAPDLVKALDQSGQSDNISTELKKMASDFLDKKKKGQALPHASGYGGKGFKFDEKEDSLVDEKLKIEKLMYGIIHNGEEELPPSLEEVTQVSDIVEKGALVVAGKYHNKQIVALGRNNKVDSASLHTSGPRFIGEDASIKNAKLAAAMEAARNLEKGKAVKLETGEMINTVTTADGKRLYRDEIDINDFPQQARWNVTRVNALAPITEWTGAAIICKGSYIPPGKEVFGSQRLHLVIESPTIDGLRNAKKEIKNILDEVSLLGNPNERVSGRYSVF